MCLSVGSRGCCRFCIARARTLDFKETSQLLEKLVQGTWLYLSFFLFLLHVLLVTIVRPLFNLQSSRFIDTASQRIVGIPSRLLLDQYLFWTISTFRRDCEDILLPLFQGLLRLLCRSQNGRRSWELRQLKILTLCNRLWKLKSFE